MLKEINLGIKSIVLYCLLNLRFLKKISMHPLNSIKGKIYIDISQRGKLLIGQFLMTTGPCYLKCGNHATIALGDRCFMNHNVSITSNESIRIGNDVNIANNVVVVDHDHIITADGVLGGINCAPVTIGNRVWIGANAVITKGVVIGDGSVIAAGAVVCSDIPEHEVWGGIPAKFIRRII